MNSKLVTVLLLLGFLGSSVFGATITKDSSSEFSASGAVFSDTKISGETVVLVNGALWADKESGKPVSTASNDQDELDTASDGAGGVFLVWRDKRTNPLGEIYASRVNSSGDIPSGWEVKVGGATLITSETPRIVKSMNGSIVDGAIIAWTFKDNIYAEKLNSSGVKQWSVKPVCSAANIQSLPDLASDGAGGACFVWRDYRDNNSAIYTQWLDASGNIKYPILPPNGITVCASSVDGHNTNADKPSIVPLRQTLTDEGFMIAWEDQRDNYNNIYAHRLQDAGYLDTTHFGTNGVSVSASSIEKNSYKMVNSLTYNGAMLVWREGASQENSDVYAQWMFSDAKRFWGNNGVRLTSAPAAIYNPTIAGLPMTPATGAIASWIVGLGGDSYTNFAQKLSGYGTPEWNAGGKNLGMPAAVQLAYDAADGVYLAGALGTDIPSMRPYAQRISGAGEELWGENGLELSPYASVMIDQKNIGFTSEDNTLIVSWIDQRNLNKDIFAQKVAGLYAAGGTYTTEKIENTDTGFAEWGSISWDAITLTAEIRTAPTSTALESAVYAPKTNGGSITGNDRWIQARMHFASDLNKGSTPILHSLSFNYSVDSAFPVIESVRIGSRTLLSGGSYWVSSTPTIDAVLTDDHRIASADIKIDGTSIGYTTVSATDTRWQIRGWPTTGLADGSYTLKVEVADDAGNPTSNTYTLEVSSVVRFEGSVGFSASSVPNEINVVYTLTAGAPTTVELRNMMGELVQVRDPVTSVLVNRFTYSSTAGSNAIPLYVGHLSRGPYSLILTPAGGTPVRARFMVP